MEEQLKLFEYNDFVTCVDEHLEEFGIKKGDTLFIIGDGFVPLEDPYNYRKVYIVLPVKDGHIVTTQKPWSVDPKAIEYVTKEEQERLTAIFQQDFSKEDQQGAMGTAEAN